MGTSGYGIRDDDTVCDVITEFEDHLKKYQDLNAATEPAFNVFPEYLEDEDDAPMFWLALAEMQWTYGNLDPQILQKVEDDFACEAGMGLWGEPTEDDYRRRRKAISRFLAKIRKPKVKPKKFPKIVMRKPNFEAGDCLAVQLSNAQYGAAYVSHKFDDEIENGSNWIITLNYLSDSPPEMDVFQKRNWLRPTHHGWNGKVDAGMYTELGFRKARDRIKLVGNLPVIDPTPEPCAIFANWTMLGEQVLLQRAWDEEHGQI